MRLKGVNFFWEVSHIASGSDAERVLRGLMSGEGEVADFRALGPGGKMPASYGRRDAYRYED